MKIINGLVARTSHDCMYGGSSDNAKLVAKIKKFSRKQERARLKLAIRSEMLLDEIDRQNAKREQAHFAADMAYRSLIERIMAKKAEKKAKRASYRAHCREAWLDEAIEPRTDVFFFANGEKLVLASCAVEYA